MPIATEGLIGVGRLPKLGGYLKLREPDQICNSRIETALAQKGSDLSAVMRLMIKEVCNRCPERIRSLLGINKARVRQRVCKLFRCQTGDPLRDILICDPSLVFQFSEFGIQLLIKRLERIWASPKTAQPDPIAKNGCDRAFHESI